MKASISQAGRRGGVKMKQIIKYWPDVLSDIWFIGTLALVVVEAVKLWIKLN